MKRVDDYGAKDRRRGAGIPPLYLTAWRRQDAGATQGRDGPATGVPFALQRPGGVAAQDTGLRAVRMDDVRLQLAQPSLDLGVADGVLDGLDRAAHLVHDNRPVLLALRLIEELPLRADGRAGDERDLVPPLGQEPARD